MSKFDVYADHVEDVIEIGTTCFRNVRLEDLCYFTTTYKISGVVINVKKTEDDRT